MGSLAYRLYDHRGAIIDGEQYYCCVSASVEPPFYPEPPENPQLEDGKDYFHFVVKYNHSCLLQPGRRGSVCLFARQRIVERQEFYSSVNTILSEILTDIPWKIPDEILVPAGPWLIKSARNAVVTDVEDFRDEFRAARVLSLEMEIFGPYREGGYEVVVEDYTDDEYELPEDELARLLNNVKLDEDKEDDQPVLVTVDLEIDDDDDAVGVEFRVKEEGSVDRTCSICLEDIVASDEREVVRTWCSHVFHKSCVVPWLNRRFACPYCRSPASSIGDDIK